MDHGARWLAVTFTQTGRARMPFSSVLQPGGAIGRGSTCGSRGSRTAARNVSSSRAAIWRVFARSLRRMPSPAFPVSNIFMSRGVPRPAAAFLKADLVDRLDLYRAPILIGEGLPAIGDIGLHDLGRDAWHVGTYRAASAWQRPVRSLSAAAVREREANVHRYRHRHRHRRERRAT